MSHFQDKGLSYKDAGVDIEAGNNLVDRIKGVAKKTFRPEVMANLGGFSALVELPSGYNQPVLVSGTDGVGTKLRLAIDLNRHDTIGIDLVAMCVNDLVVCGAEPLYFLDYFATGALDVDVGEIIIKGIAVGCQQAGCSLVGGETAEMPGMYKEGDYDLAGFCTGIVEKSKIIDGRQVSVGDKLIALPSSGPHANGYSLIRKIIATCDAQLSEPFDDTGQSLADAVMAPTRIYVQTILRLIKEVSVDAMSHITGGGFFENIPRILPEGTKAIVNQPTWQVPSIFNWLKNNGKVSDEEMFRTFNCGVGMVIVVPAPEELHALEVLKTMGESPWVMGDIQATKTKKPFVEIVKV